MIPMLAPQATASKHCILLLLLLGSTRLAATLSSEGERRYPTPLLIGVDHRLYRPLELGSNRAAVLLFVLQDCPICNGYAPQIQRIASEYGPKQTAFYLVHVDPALTTAQADEHAREYGYKMPVLVDRQHELVSRLGVVAVPTALVLDSEGSVRYRGRIDDRYAALGKAREKTSTHELRDALESVLAGREVQVAHTRVIGCAVPELPTTQPAP